MPEKCKDCDKPADPDCTMRFDDIGKPPLYWCTEHAKRARVMVKLILDFVDKAPGNKEKFEKALYKYNN